MEFAIGFIKVCCIVAYRLVQAVCIGSIGDGMSGISVCPYISYVGMFGMVRYNLIHTVSIAGQYIGMDR